MKVAQIARWILEDQRRVLDFGHNVEDSWSGTMCRLRQIEGGAFMSHDEVEYFILTARQMEVEEQVNEMYEREQAQLAAESHDHAQGFGL